MGKAKVPSYRIAALAQLELDKRLQDDPLTVSEAKDVDWDVSQTEYHYIARGNIVIPVELYYGNVDDADDEPELRRLIVSGKREFDARVDDDDDDEEPEQSPTYGVNETAVRVQSVSQYLKGLGAR